ncbi:MAG: hypothetical protein R6U64_06955, partial [Bacteroidales bacterium]
MEKKKENSNWTVVYKGFNREEHPLQEALCTLGNGYFATRGALEMELHAVKVKTEDKVKVKGIGDGKAWNYPGTYLAGGYNRMKSKEGKIENEDLVNWPNWLYLTFRINGGKWFDIDEVELLLYETHLHLKEGILERRMRFRDHDNHETTLISRRLVSQDDYHVGAIQWKFTPENWEGEMILRSGIDGNIINNNVARYSDLNQDHIKVMRKGHFNNNSIFLKSRTKQSKIYVAQAAHIRILRGEEVLDIEQQEIEQGDFVAGDFRVPCQKGQTLTIEKIASFYTSRDIAISEPLLEAQKRIHRVVGFPRLEVRHKQYWQQLWHYEDIRLNTNKDLDQLIVRLHIFHLYQTVSSNSIDYDIGVPARGWHGEAYRGHIFWDELYIMPFINLQNPALARSLLMYRYHRLQEAHHAAKEHGWRGAVFPWQSGSNGREETQKLHLNPKSGRWLPDVSHLQYHINAAIPFNVWHYYQSTGDMDFLLTHGAKIILSTALFWSSIAEYNEERDRYEILKVMGPDEYHTQYPDADEPGLNNNAYTNIMAVWVIQTALKVLDLLDINCHSDLEQTVGFKTKDVERWNDIIRKMYVPFQGNIIMQFEGFEKLKELDWNYYYEKYNSTSLRLDRILEAEGDSP